MEKDRLESQIRFILEADKEKNIFRQTHLTGYTRRENDAEHAWHMALMIYLLKEYANEEFDIAKAMMMALIHDVVEIDAGDAYAYDPKALEHQKEREEAAAKRIFALLPPDQEKEIKELFYEFEENKTSEAKFVHAMDNFQPLLLNDANNGEDWRVHDVSLSKIMDRQKGTIPGSQIIWDKTMQIIEENVKKGNIKK